MIITFTVLLEGIWLRNSKALHSFIFLMCFLVIMAFFRISKRFYQHPTIKGMAITPRSVTRPRSPVHWAKAKSDSEINLVPGISAAYPQEINQDALQTGWETSSFNNNNNLILILKPKPAPNKVIYKLNRF